MKLFFARLLFLLITLFSLQGCMRKLIDNITFQVKSSNDISSLNVLQYREILLNQKGREVRAWFAETKNNANSHTVVILFNGIGGHITDWVYFQKCLADSGIASVSFDYGPQSDTLKKKGASRLSDVTKDINTIIDILKKEYGYNLNLFLLGHSVGNAVMLEMYSHIDTSFLKGVIICNAFASLKKWNIQHRYLPKAFAFIFPDYFNNVTNIQKVYKPVLIMHSKSDSVNLFSDGVKVFKSANSNKQFVGFDNFGHNDIDKKDNYIYRLPIINFIKKQSDK